MNLTDGSASQRFQIERCEELSRRRAQVFANNVGNDACGHWSNFVLQLGQFVTISIGQQVATRGKRLSKLDKHGSKFLAGAAKMFSACPFAGLVLDKFIVGDANTVTCEHSQNFAVALALGNHGANRLPGLEWRFWLWLAGIAWKGAS